MSRARVRAVLVRPENPANIGAVARALRNTGIEELRLVRPGDWRTLECWRSAWGAHELLEQAVVCETLEAALLGVTYAVALSGRHDLDPPPLDVRVAAHQIAALPAGEQAALVFGPESSGLTFAELALCGRRALIPSHPSQPSLNLSHAVMVAGYEVFRAASSSRDGEPAEPRVRHEQKEALLALLRDGLAAAGALPRERAEVVFRDWRALVQRIDLTPRELRLLQHLARRLNAPRARG